MTNPNKPQQVLVVMSDTGGGHRAAAEAINAAAQQRYPGAFEFTLVDVFRHHTPFPFKRAPEIYPRWVNYAALTWGMSYHMTNGIQRSKIAVSFLHFYWQRGLRRMLDEHPADLILCVHSIICRPVMKAVQERSERPPFVTVVTDLVSTHAFWYAHEATRCLVPTQTAYERGLECGLTDEQLSITGLPVHPRFIQELTSRDEARRELDIDMNLPAVLLVSGGEGMGPVFKIADAINQKRLDCQLLIVAGRNEKLKAQLEAHHWNQPTQIYGFVDFMPKLMAAADMLVTKAGPATISEACMAGLPIIISGAVPGQEAGNIDHVVNNEIGVFAPSPRKVANAVEEWLHDDPRHLKRRSERAKALARPDAVWDIVEEIRKVAKLTALPATESIPNNLTAEPQLVTQ